MRAEGRITRGTTHTNRLRRVDRWIDRLPVLRQSAAPLVVDLGYGASGVTAMELAARLAPRHPGAEVLGLEIDPERVARAREQLAAVRRGETPFPRSLRVSFARGGFEVPAPRRPQLVRAFNVLRQYDEGEVARAWERMTSRLAPGGVLVEGTCNEIGRIASWVDVTADGPQRFTISLHLPSLETPSIAAERLPKALIHRNVPGERIHDLLAALDREWERAAHLAPFGRPQRFAAAVSALRDAWPVENAPRLWRRGEITLPWSAVAPRGDATGA